MGASLLAGNCRSAFWMKTGSGMMQVTIDSALMPGSNTPKPPACQIHCWPGCQWRTSSFQVTRSRLISQPASAFFASCDGLVILGVPRGEDGLADLVGQELQVLKFAQGGGGRLFQEHALAREKRLAGDLVAHLRRRADGDRLDVRHLFSISR